MPSKLIMTHTFISYYFAETSEIRGAPQTLPTKGQLDLLCMISHRGYLSHR